MEAVRGLVKGVWELGPPTPAFRFRPPEGKVVAYEGRDVRDNRPVTVVLVRGEWGRDSQLREFGRYGIEKLRLLDHPNVIRIFDLIDEEEHFGYVTEPLLGDNIFRKIRYRAATFTEAEVVRTIADVAAGLEHAHSRGVIFGSIKPPNIELTPEGTAKIAALPRPRYAFASFLDAGWYLGFPMYHAPELLRCQELDERTDVYGLGITAYEMIVSSLPYQATGNLGADLSSIALREWPAPAEVLGPDQINPVLDRLVRSCVHKDPDKRYPSAASVRNQLKRVQGKDVPLISRSRLLEMVKGVFPFPLAGLAESLERNDHVLAQKGNLLNQAKGLITFLGFLAAKSLGAPLPCDPYARPSLGHWVALLRQALDPSVARWPLAEFRSRVANPAAFLAPLEEIVRLRNAAEHMPFADEGRQVHDWVGRMSANLRQAYKNLLFLAHYPLVFLEDIDYEDSGQFRLTVRHLGGLGAPSQPVQLTSARPYSKGRVYFASDDFAHMLSLDPFLVLAKCADCYQRELFFYARATGDQVEYAAHDSGHLLSCPVPPDFEKALSPR